MKNYPTILSRSATTPPTPWKTAKFCLLGALSLMPMAMVPIGRAQTPVVTALHVFAATSNDASNSQAH